MTKIGIVGGGLVGSLLSIYMAQAGFKVDVYERRPDTRKMKAVGGRSINLALSNRGWKALEEVGIADEIKELAIPMNGRVIHQADGTVDFQPYGKEGEAIYSVSREGLNNALDALSMSLPQVDYHYDAQCEDIDIQRGILYFSNYKEKKFFKAKPDIIFGADGAFSKVRLALQMRKRFDYTQDYLEHGYKELTIPAGENGTWQIEKNALHIWPRRSFMLIALPNLDGSFTCTLFLSFEGKESFENLKTPEAVIEFFQTEFSDALPLMPTLIQNFFENPTDALITVRCFPWTYNDKFLLIGDASHAIVPFYGQGMNSGFEDCRVFNQLLHENKGEGGDDINWANLCQEYENLRKPDAEAIADFALKNFIEMRDSVADDNFLLRKTIEKYLQKQHPDVFTPTYSLVTFKDEVRYSEAMRRSKIQDKLFAKLFKTKNIAKKWEKGELTNVLDKLVEEYKGLV